MKTTITSLLQFKLVWLAVVFSAVWAQAWIGGTVSIAPDTPSRPLAGRTESASNSKRETGHEAADRSMTGVASITFLNPVGRR